MKTLFVTGVALAAFALPAAASAQESDWRPLDPQNTLVLEVHKRGQTEPLAPVVIELAPELAPNHAARIKALTRQGFYDGRTFHRVLDDFMAQAGGTPTDDQGGDSGLPDLRREFVARIGPDAPIAQVQDARRRAMDGVTTQAGFLDGFPVAYQPAAQAMVSVDGKRDVWMLHCKGTLAMARTPEPDTANFQFYITRGEPDWLDGDYTAFGRVRAGQDTVDAIKTGEPVAAPDTILRMRLMSDLPPEERPNLEVMRTDSEAFAQIVADARAAASGADINVCSVDVPVREAQ